MTTKEKIEFYTCHLEDRARNMWKVIEVSDLEDIMETYHQEQVKKINIDDVSPRCFIVMERLGEEVEQLSIGFKTMKEAKDFMNDEYHKKHSPEAFIVCELNEG